MGVNIVRFGNDTIMDISDSTVTAEILPRGVVAYNASGERIVGMADYVSQSDFNDLKRIVDGLGTPIRLYDFTKTLSPSVTLRPVSDDTVPGDGNSRVDIVLPTDMGADWKIASVAKLECYNGSTRIDAAVIYQFSMNLQKTMRVGLKTTGAVNKTINKVSGALLLTSRAIS